MPTHGGRRPGSGRPPGILSPHKKLLAPIVHKTPHIAEIKPFNGASPGDNMLSIMNYHMGRAAKEQMLAKEQGREPDDKLMRIELGLALEAADRVAPYVHRRLAQLHLANPDGSPLLGDLSELIKALPTKDLNNLVRILEPLAAAALTTPGSGVGGGNGQARTPPSQH